MAHRSDDVEKVRSVESPSAEEDPEKNISSVNEEDRNGDGDVDKDGAANEGDDGDVDGDGGVNNGGELLIADNGDEDADLPQCKIKRNYSCSLCPFFSQNPRSFLYHSRDVHFDRIKIFECSQCLYASKHSQKLQRHINMIHTSGKNRVRRMSKMVKVERKKELRPIKPKPVGSVTSAESGATRSPESNEFDCSILESFLKTETETPSEVEGEDEQVDGEFKCSVCNFKNKNQKLMRRHEKVVHLKKRFLRCSKCSYVTHVKARYTKHVKYHSMPMIKCDLCDFRTPYKWNLDRHYKNHCGSGAFQCSKCNFRADIKQSLTVHEMNHHVPPVGQGAVTARKKNKVGASETSALDSEAVDLGEMDLLRMDREDLESDKKEESDNGREDETDLSLFQNIRNIKVPYINKRECANNNHLQTDFIHPDDVVPRYGQIYVKNLKCKFCSYKAVFSHEIGRHEKRIHGYIRPESKKETNGKRPPPKLIPIQNKNSSATSGLPSSAILKIPAVKNKTVVCSQEIASPGGDKCVNENEFNEMCKKSSLTSSLKDIVSLIGDEEGLKTIPDSSRSDDFDIEFWAPKTDEDPESKIPADPAKQKQTDLLKKKNASFFDKLKEKLMTGNSEKQSLFCELCNHESKCLSEAVAHQKRHSDSNFKSDLDSHMENDVVLSGTELSSTRCQHCRQRCKTSNHLINHLKSCKAFGALQDFQMNADEVEGKIKAEEESDEKLDEGEKSMENRVFVWNDLALAHDEDEDRDLEKDVESRSAEDYQMSASYEAVASKGSDSAPDSEALLMEVDSRQNLTVKKVFKCPHCSFWASTASRFHVHIVGHLNKKPFECSLCLYRSNWRWDITKHIRLKSARDPSHLEAQVNMTDETGRRNYSKYNKYLTMMKVQEATAESSGTGRRSKPAEATQGNVTDRDIIPLPAPPRLIRAPVPGTPHQIVQGVPLRPPPPLKAAHQTQPPMAKCLKDKKTLWKCKKCNFRDSSKISVLAHVKEHYGDRTGNGSKGKLGGSAGDALRSAEGKGSTEAQKVAQEPSAKVAHKTPSYKCGHCHQVSNWKHVIQRHCRLKHNGNALIQVGWKEGSTVQCSDARGSSENLDSVEDSIELISCDICPFTTDTEGDLTAHKLNHVDRLGSIFKCSYCPFYVPSKTAVLEHMEIHGVKNGCDLINLKVDNFDPSERNEDFSAQNRGNGSDSSKRYKCSQCPYLTNSKTQFLYHKQFHRPRNAPFKCMYCSYNVSRRHLLRQHLRVHHRGGKDVTGPENTPGISTPIQGEDIDMAAMIEIPLVWVLKSGNYQKMFKCRWCPHVNARKINIQEHEKMHGPEQERCQPRLRLSCSVCNYSCNHAGVLASHAKVHQGIFGEIRCLVDPTRPDAVQIHELRSRSTEVMMEPEVVIKEEPEEKVPGEFDEDAEERFAHEEPLSSQPENVYNHSSSNLETDPGNGQSEKVLNFCSKCPARFFYEKEFRIHSKFHLIKLPFKCSYCSYTVRQRPHLLAHRRVHTEDYQRKTVQLADLYGASLEHPQPRTVISTGRSEGERSSPVWVVEMAEDEAERNRDLIRHELDRETGKWPREEESTGESLQKKEFFKGPELPKLSRRRRDPQFGVLIHGSPEFIYPTYFKNGKIKEKRYKCHKCPSAFEKRDQYRIHLSLHGSSQKYPCDKCDYSVKYYANYIQHMRKHQIHDEALKTRNVVKIRTGPEKSGSLGRSPNDKRKANGNPGQCERKIFDCPHCPYASNRRDATDNHVRRHYSVSRARTIYECSHCDYSALHKNFLREHVKLHFAQPQKYKPEAYLMCERMELWCSEDTGLAPSADSSFLIFRDRGEDEEERFYPPLDGFDEDGGRWRLDADPDPVLEMDENAAAAETEGVQSSPIPSFDSGEGRKAPEGPPPEHVSGPRRKGRGKRWRGKNWKCKKCPHAFGKKDQYLRHVALHGSNQKHNCGVCDYSVKFYTNYVQHMRMHQMHEPGRLISIRGNSSIGDEGNEAEEANGRGKAQVEESDSSLAEEKKSFRDGCEETDREYFCLTDGTEVTSEEEETGAE